MRPVPERQARQSHRERKALARVRHQLQYMIPRWLNLWNKWQRRGGPRPQRIKLPYAVRKHKRALYTEFVQIGH
jgi:hypothetical protein